MTDTEKPWLVDDALWALVAPLLPVRPRRARHPGRRPLARLASSGGLEAVARGIAHTASDRWSDRLVTGDHRRQLRAGQEGRFWSRAENGGQSSARSVTCTTNAASCSEPTAPTKRTKHY